MILTLTEERRVSEVTCAVGSSEAPLMLPTSGKCTFGWLVKPVRRRVVSEEVLAGTEIP